MSYIKTISIHNAKNLIDVAMKQEEQEILFRYYLTIFPNMDKKSFVTFRDYYEKNKTIDKVKQDLRSQEEILEEIVNLKF